MGVQQKIAIGGARLPPGTRVLIVEDQPFVALAACDMVLALGGTVTDVPATIEQALAEVAKGDFTIALLDIDLDGRTSEPVAMALAAAAKPFLVTTGFSRRTIKGFENAPRLVKPYMANELGRRLAELLEPAP